MAADLLVLAAKDRSIPIIRFNQDEFPSRARIHWQDGGQTRFYCEGRSFGESDISGAWFRKRPRNRECDDHVATFTARESQGFLGGLWETAPWFWMSAPAAVARAEHKLLQLHHAHLLGFTIPKTLATNCPEAARDFTHLGPTIAKTVVGGRVAIDGVGHTVFTTSIASGDMIDDDAIQACPVIFQFHVQTSFDVRVTVVEDRIFAARIVITDRTEKDVDWRKAEPARLDYEHVRLPADLEAKCIKLVATLGLTYGALDFVVTPEDEYVFLELNPAGQWGWIERMLRLPITDAILDRLKKGAP